MDTSYLRHHAETRGFMLGRPVRSRPTPDAKHILFLRAQPRVARLSLYEYDVATGKTREILTPEAVLKGAEENLSAEEKARRERQRVSVGGFTDFQLSEDGKLILVSLSGKLYLVQRDSAAIRELPTGPGTLLDPRFAPNGKSLAYVRDFNLYVLDFETGKETALTSGGTEKKSFGLAEFVAQEEMDRHHGYWWSPDSQAIVYQESDASHVEIWYVADPIKPEQSPHISFYPRPGKANVDVRLGIIPARGGPTRWIDWDVKTYPYLTDVRWDKRGPLTIAVQTREQKEIALLQVDPQTGKTTSLLKESDPAWINLHKDSPRWIDAERFLWSAQRNGGPQLELRDRQGTVHRVLATSELGYRNLVDVDTNAGRVVYRASTDPTQIHLFRCGLDESAKPVPLSREAGVHNAVFARNHAVYVHEVSPREGMPRTFVHRGDGTRIGELPSVAEDPPFTVRDELVHVGEGKGFHAVITRPHDFDAKKRYPVIVHVYGGPLHQQVLATMNQRLLAQWFADQGFVVVSIENRGTPGRGRDWERAVSKRFGSVPLEDQAAGVQALCQRFPEMDGERIGIYGWSFGGYMSGLAVLRRPDVFKAGVAGAPVVDWLDYDTHYTERYLGLPQSNPDAYREGSLLTYAADLKRPLLLVHGTADDNVYFRHSLKLADALFRAGKDFDILPLSGLTHMVPDPVVTQNLYGRIVGYFQKHLGRPAER